MDNSRRHRDLPVGRPLLWIGSGTASEPRSCTSCCRLTGLELAALAARAGRVPGGYVEPGEAASELVEEALAPVESDLRRSIDLGLRQAARQILLGLITGMHRCSDPPEGTVLAHAGPDTLTEHATWLVDQMQRAGLELDADELQERCPRWF